MTCEVMLMNLEGVSLAADSAVTIISARRQQTLSQRGVDKVFVLDEAAPIGAMIYGVASFADFPWKTVLGAFRASAQAGYDSIEDCARSLIAFLGGLDSGGAGPLAIPERAEAVSFAEYVEGFVDRFHTLLSHRGWDGEGRPPEDMAAQALGQLRDEILLDATYVSPGIVKPPSERRERPLIAQPSKRLAGFLAANLGSGMDRSLKRYFPKGGLEAVRAPLETLCAQSVLVEWLPPALPTTGLVLSGFGRRAHTPTYVNLHVLGAFAGVLQYRYDAVGGPVAGRQPVVFESFAQDESIAAFRYGAQNRFMAVAYDATVMALARVFEEMLELIARKDEALAAEAAVIADRALLQAPATGLIVAMSEREGHVARTFGPLLDSASVDVLGAHATKLVELAIIEHELTGSGAVGRPISVLKMEKGRCRLEKDGA